MLCSFLGSLNALSIFTSGSEHLRRAEMARSILRLTDRKQIAGQLLLCAMCHASLQRSEINTVQEPSVHLEDTSPTDGDGPDLFFLSTLLFCGGWYQDFSQLSRLHFHIILTFLPCPVSMCSHLSDPGFLSFLFSFLACYHYPCSVLDIILSFSTCLQSTYCMLGLVLGFGDVGVDETRFVATCGH